MSWQSKVVACLVAFLGAYWLLSAYSSEDLDGITGTSGTIAVAVAVRYVEEVVPAQRQVADLSLLVRDGQTIRLEMLAEQVQIIGVRNEPLSKGKLRTVLLLALAQTQLQRVNEAKSKGDFHAFLGASRSTDGVTIADLLDQRRKETEEPE